MPSNNRARTVLVTGAAGAIGRVVAASFAEAGHLTIMADKSPTIDEAARAIAEKGGRVEALLLDVTDEAAIEAAAADIFARHGVVDILVNNAGFGLRPEGISQPPALKITLSDWSTVITGNLTSTFLMSRAFVPAMIEKGWGRVINMSSLGGRIGSRVNGMHYSAAKAGIIGLTRTLAVEVARNGITVNVVAPGRIATERNVREGTRPGIIENFIPVGRLGTMEEVADAVMYLASDGASYVTGTVLDVNGGWYMG